MSPDGKKIALVSSDGTVKLWNVETGQLLSSLAEYEGWVCALSFSPNNNKLATAGADRTIILWDLESVEQFRPANSNMELEARFVQGCQWLRDYLTANFPPYISQEDKKLCD
jgi:WD40 repeat protein